MSFLRVFRARMTSLSRANIVGAIHFFIFGKATTSVAAARTGHFFFGARLTI